MKCKYCDASCIKKGKQKDVQTYYCKKCLKYQQASYVRKLKEEIDSSFIEQLHNEGMGVRSMGRIIKVSATTIVRKMRWLSSRLKPVIIEEQNQVYEIDEMRTIVGNKKNAIWITHGVNRKTGKEIARVIGKRDKATIRKVVEQILQLNPRRIITDGYNVYSGLIPKSIHTVCKKIMTRIERMHLTIRTHLKRLSRETICFSRSKEMLENALKLYFSKECFT